MSVARSLPLVLALACVAGLHAHHGSADYHVDREVTVTGTVTEWKFSNPHTWVYLTVTRPGGGVEAWNGEGPPLQWASSRGWSNATLKIGETVRLVMYPSRRDASKRADQANRAGRRRDTARQPSVARRTITM